MSDLPKGWLECQLGEVVEYGKTNKIEPIDIPENTWMLELEDIEKDTSKLLKRLSFSERLSKSTKNCFKKGDVLYGKLRPYLNKVIIADQAGFCTTEIVPISPNSIVYGGYLFYWFKNSDFLEYVESVSHGIQMPRLGTEAGLKAPFRLAPLAEQKRIVTKLDNLFAHTRLAREELDHIPKLIERYKQAILSAAFRGDLTADWRKENNQSETQKLTSIGDIALSVSYGSSAKSSPTGSIPVLRMGNIQDGKLDWNDLVFTSNIDEIEKYKLLDGDVLFNRTNSPELVGKTAVYKNERPAIYAGYLIRIRCKSEIMPDYLNYCLNSPEGRNYCFQVKSDGVSQSNINAKKLAAFTFHLPSIEEQKEIVKRVENYFQAIDRLEQEYQKAIKLCDRLE